MTPIAETCPVCSHKTKHQHITHEDQIRRWIDGDSVHRVFTQEVSSDDGARIVEVREAEGCCPDFSCCQPSLQATIEVRQAFATSSERDRIRMLGAFLGAAVELANKHREERGERPARFHITTGEEPNEA